MPACLAASAVAFGTYIREVDFGAGLVLAKGRGAGSGDLQTASRLSRGKGASLECLTGPQSLLEGLPAR